MVLTLTARLSALIAALCLTLLVSGAVAPAASSAATGGSTTTADKVNPSSQTAPSADLYYPGTTLPRAWTQRNRSPEATRGGEERPAPNYVWQKFVKCSTTSLSSTCWQERWNPWPAGQYCSSSVGCFNYPLGSTRNWSLKHYACCWTEAQVHCVANVVYTGISFLATPAVKLFMTATGIGLTVWGCHKVFY